MPFIISKIINYLWFYLTRDVQELCTEHYKILPREVKRELNKRRDKPWVGRLNVLKSSFLTKSIFWFRQPRHPSRLCCVICLFVDSDKLILKFMWQCRGSRATKIPLKQKKLENLLHRDCKIYKVIIIKIV